ncbi:PREDICTED: kunitz-type serine protease inhibitor-like isoform X2 [Vollenhovia emeryi]|uniref:kunitz-type serine protease inhibitor-like isoform X2 n=1 Tax=Vollenhovia emeryi TaxID=411798 RepID=UPI0005F41019|nr:PREDICTED: kunitz-type serine protease inhibitor-like isoform X2 [Vollenhovia emeryi]XP_011873053.1 PREDICTED: kunitz-type serine protease inhibitor-like isoform X2 [Vollenhovia emeryi]
MDLKPRLLLLFVFVSVLTCEVLADRPELCQLPVEGGTCRAYITRYAYNPATGQCERFIYTGCGANENNFKSRPKCEETCKNV